MVSATNYTYNTQQNKKTVPTTIVKFLQETYPKVLGMSVWLASGATRLKSTLE